MSIYSASETIILATYSVGSESLILYMSTPTPGNAGLIIWPNQVQAYIKEVIRRMSNPAF